MPSFNSQSSRLIFALSTLVVVLVIGVAAFRPWQRGPLSDEDLVQQALTASDSRLQNAAASELIGRKRESVPHIRRLYHQSDEPTVRAACIQGMGRLYDYQSMETLLEAMEDESPLVRARANRSVVRMIGLDGHFDPNGPLEDRQRIIGFYRMQWEQMRGTGRLKEFEQTVQRRYGAEP